MIDKRKVLLTLKLDGTSAKLFRKWINAFKVISFKGNDILFRNTKKGLEVTQMNPERVGLVFTLFEKALFDTWEANYISFGLDWDRLKKLVKYVKINDGLTIKINSYAFILETKTTKIGIPLIDLGDVTYPPPNLEKSTTTCSLESSVFADLIRRIKELNAFDHLRFLSDTKKNTLRIECFSESMELKERLEIYSFDINDDADARYSLDYFASCNDAFKLGEMTYIKYSGAMPFMLEWKMSDKSFFQYYLAPRIET